LESAKLYSQISLEAAELLREGAALTALQRCSLRLIQGRALRSERNYEELVASLAGIDLDCASLPTELREARFLIASGLSLTTELDAAPLYRALMEAAPHAKDSPLALFYEADVYLKANQERRAGLVWREIVKRFPRHPLARKSSWRLARATLRDTLTVQDRRKLKKARAKAKAALVDYERLARAAHSSFDQDRARFWLGTLELEHPHAARRRAGIRRLLRIARAHPFSFYGVYAASLLKGEAPDSIGRVESQRHKLLERVGGQPRLRVRRSFLRDPVLRAARSLIRRGLLDDAKRLLMVRTRGKAIEGEILSIARLLLLVEGRAEAQMLLRTRASALMGDAPTAGNLWVYRVSYPRLYRDEVARAALESKVRPALLFAIMREESAFDPRARSWAGAIGLAQLMPLSALDAARRLGLRASPSLDESALFLPSLNLRLAARLLHEFGEHFGFAAPLQIAAYNAGPRSLEEWIGPVTKSSLPFLIESLGFAETRRYTRRVIRSMAIYSALYGVGAARSLLLPLSKEKN